MTEVASCGEGKGGWKGESEWTRVQRDECRWWREKREDVVAVGRESEGEGREEGERWQQLRLGDWTKSRREKERGGV